MAAIPIMLGLPERLRDIATKLSNYGFLITREGITWRVDFPPNDPIDPYQLARYAREWGGVPGMSLASARQSVGFDEASVSDGLLKLLRFYEERHAILHRYEQFDKRWKEVVYGTKPGDTTIGQAGCGPTSLAIVLQYLMNNGSRPRQACYAVSPLQTANYASTHGRVSGHGTAGDPMIKGIKDHWKGFDGVRVTLDEAASLLEEGRLIIFLCKGCEGRTRLGRAVRYGGHYMVLAGIDEGSGPNRLFYVVDPGRNQRNAMRAITHTELKRHCAGFWWVYSNEEVTESISD